MEKEPISRSVYIISIVCVMVMSFAATAGAADILDEDIVTVSASRAGLQSVTRYVDDHMSAMLAKNQAMPTDDERNSLRSAWGTFLDHVLSLDAVGERNNRLYHSEKGSRKDKVFQISFAAFLSEYRYALEFIKHAERLPQIHTILNEPVPELGLPANTYSHIKYRFLNVARASELSWLSLRYKTIRSDSPLSSFIDEDTRYILSINTHGGPVLTAKNAGKIVADTVFTAWFPVQKGVSEWMGDTKVLRHGKNLVTDAQLKELHPRLQPGDVLLVRREWYLSNAGLPGYWPHAAIYIGTPKERQEYFSDKQVKAWVITQGEPSGDIEKLLSSSSRSNYQKSNHVIENESLRVIEAISEGVTFTSLEHAAGGDSLAVLRPRLEKTVKARAILRAFQMAGRPYDFDFNFVTDASLVCTELVYKAYEGEGGLSLPLENVMGRPVLSANRIAQLYDEEYSGPSQQFDFVAFYDGDERSGRAIESDVKTFRSSSKRPKWHIFLPASGTKWVKAD